MSVYHLRQLERRWSLVHASTGRILKVFDSFRQGLQQSSDDIARHAGCLIVYKRDGSIAELRRFQSSTPDPKHGAHART